MIPVDRTSAVVDRLEWDSRHFGLMVGRLSGPGDEAMIAAGLEAARRDGFDLVYLATEPGQTVGERLLDEYWGRRWTTNVTFGRELGEELLDGVPPVLCGTRPESLSADRASAEVLSLAVAAGWTSRFQIDPFVPRERFVAMYREWVERSLRREIAAEVIGLIEGGRPVGLVTVSPVDTNGLASIGLLAVSEECRGRGLGGRLLREAESVMRRLGAIRARVVTQKENASACRLYSSWGFTPMEERDMYHFWPQRNLAAVGELHI